MSARPLSGTLLQDVRFGLRMLGNRPGITFAAVACLAIGIAACTTVFSFVESLLLSALPYPQASELYALWESNPAKGEALSAVSRLNLGDWRRQANCFEGLAGLGDGGFILTGGGPPEEVVADFASSELFSILRMRPLLGRWLLPSDDAPGRDHVVLLSYGFWRRRFGGDAAVLGRSITLDGEPYEVVGVLPRSFHGPFGAEADLWAPLSLYHARTPEVRQQRDLWCLGRLRPDVTAARARLEMAAIAGRLAREYPEADGGWGVRLMPVRDLLGGAFGPALWFLFGAALLVLLLACANVAALLLARSTERQGEFAVRLALGASRGRLVCQLLVESAMLALAGAAAGLLLTAWALLGIRKTLLAAYSHVWYLQLHLDGAVILFAVFSAVYSSLLFGSLPAWRAARSDLNVPLKEASGLLAGDRRVATSRRILVSVQVALALGLLLSTGLLTQSFLRTVSAPSGFDAHRLLTFRLTRRSAEASLFWDQVLARVRAIHGVSAAGAAWAIPDNGDVGLDSGAVSRSAASARESGDLPRALWISITPDYFRAMGIPLLRGRPFTSGDGPSSATVVILSRKLERELWPSGGSIGETLLLHRMVGAPLAVRVVGIVGDVRMHPGERTPAPCLYLPVAQTGKRVMFFAVRTESDPSALIPAVKATVWGLDKDQPFDGPLLTMEQRLSRYMLWPRFMALLLACFAAAGWLLALLGVAGISAEAVAVRRREMGIRMALGASPGTLVRLFLWSGMKPVLIGLAAGLAAFLAAARLLHSAVYGLGPLGPFSFGAALFLLTATALLVCYIPARAFQRLEPSVVLR